LNKFDKEIRELLYDAEMPVSSTLWDKIEQRIDTKPDKPKYWMVFLLTAIAIPALYISIVTVSKNDGISTDKATAIHLDKYSNTNHTGLRNTYNNTAFISENISNIDDSNVTENRSLVAEKETEQTPLFAHISDVNQSVEKENALLQNFNDEIFYDKPVKSVLLKFGSINKLAPIESLISFGIESNMDSGDKRPFIQRLFSPATACPRFSNKIKGLYSWVDYSSAYSKQTLSSNNSELDDNIRLRDASERSAYSFSTSLGMGFIHTSGWFIESGLTYDQINTQFHQREENVIGTEEIIRTSKDEDGTITGTYTEIIPIIGYNEIKHINKLTQIEVPLLFGYEIPIRPSLNFSVKAGPNFNLSSRSSGRVLDLDGNPIYFGDNSDVDLHKDNFGIGYIAGAHFIKDIDNSFSVNFGFSYKSYGETQYDENPISSSFTKYGFSTGIRYRFL